MSIGVDVNDQIRQKIVDTVQTVIVTSVLGCLVAAILLIADVVAIPIASTIGLAILNTILAAIAALGITAPVLAPLALVLGAIAIFGGKEKLKEKLRTVDIPHGIRTIIISEERISGIVSDQAWSVKNKIAEGIRKSNDFNTKVAKSFNESLQRQYEQNAQDLALHIYD